MNFNLLNEKRRAWSPNNPAPLSETSTASMTMSRCLSLTPLEPAVASYIKEGIDRSDKAKLGVEAITTLQLNILDEQNHEIALTRAKVAMKDYDSSFESEANELIKEWQSLHDHPITTAAVLENGVFFVILPLYGQFGSASLRLSGASISGDERIHVTSHRAVSQMIGARPSKRLNQLRVDTVAWLSQDLGEQGNPSWNQKRMLTNSESLITRGLSDLYETRISSVNAPFELNNNSMDSYA